MSTRGAYGFRINERDLISYNHSDSYPDYLGVEVLKSSKTIAELSVATITKKLKALKVITKKSKAPTKKDIKALAPWTDLSVSNQSTSDWYCLTRNMQGDLLAHFKAGYISDSSQFLGDSLFCEWAYIFNVDTMQLEVYKGFNKNPQAAGRYAKLNEDEAEYYGVRLVATYPLKKLPSQNRFLKDMAKVEEQE